MMDGKTVIVSAHRLSAIARTSRMVVMRDGRILEDGTHAALRTREGRYSTAVGAAVGRGH